MTDVVTYNSGGRTYRVSGLGARAAAISGASRQVDSVIADRVEAAEAALLEWRGPHGEVFAEQLGTVNSKLAAFKLALWNAAHVCSSFPDAPYSGMGTSRYVDSVYDAASVNPPAPSSTVSADPPALRRYVTAATAQDASLPGLAATVNLDGVTATVTEPRPLNAAERQELLDAGVPPQIVGAETTADTRPIDPAELVHLPVVDTLVAPLRAASVDLCEFTSAVATAFEGADQGLLELLADHPDLAGYIVAGGPEGRVSGEASLTLLLAYFDTADIAAEGGDLDGKVSRDDLEAMAGNTALPQYVRDAASHLLASPALFDLAAHLGDDDDRLTTSGIATLLDLNAQLRTVEANFEDLDVAHDGGDPDGHVSDEDLEAAAADPSLPQEVRDAARWLLDHDEARGTLGGYAATKALSGSLGGGFIEDGGGFERLSLIGVLVDGQAYGDDPAGARRFAESLPVADGGGQGLPIWLCSDDGVRALAGAALRDTYGDLTDQQSVIAHLPESTGAVRNELITAFYDMLAQRADGVFAGNLTGDPSAPGHPGANWLIYAPWASNGVHDVITGDFSVWGVNPGMGQRQAAADGNQWIFNDITARYAAFVELYEANPNPSPDHLETFFSQTFDDGDAQIRNGFVAYAAAMAETDPTRRQRLMFQGNTLVATHEQAGAQPYLEGVGLGYVPDDIEAEFIDVQMGSHRIEVNEDLSVVGGANNLLVGQPILDLDPAGLSPASFSTAGNRFSSEGAGTVDTVDLQPISGIEGFDLDTHTWYDEGGESTRYVATPYGAAPVPEHLDPDADVDGRLPGTAATTWTDYNERMWSIHRLFEQTHTDPSLYDTGSIDSSFENLRWLQDQSGVRLGVP